VRLDLRPGFEVRDRGAMRARASRKTLVDGLPVDLDIEDGFDTL
jgi:hypothetical protein